MTWFRQNWFKIWITVILLVSLAFYINYLRSDQKGNENAKKGEYIAGQKRNCLEIYKAEIETSNNTKEWNYNVQNDKCEITYRDSSPATDSECREVYKAATYQISDSKLIAEALREEMRCMQGVYMKEF